MEVLKDLPDNSVDMIYSDPDYNVGINYAGDIYNLEWDKYIDWYGELMTQSMRVLKDNGNLFTINYPKQNSYLRVRYLDKLAYNVEEYCWVYNTGTEYSQKQKRFSRAHRSILHATKSEENQFYKQEVVFPYARSKDPKVQRSIANGSLGRMPYSWFYFNQVKNVSPEKTIHPCQIPLQLAKMLFLVSTKPDDTIFILFGGSGSEICLAKMMKRNYISCEINKTYYDMIQARIARNGYIPHEYKLVFGKKEENLPLLKELL